MFSADTYMFPILGAVVPLFGTPGDVPSGLQSQSGFCLICFCGGECNVSSSHIELSVPEGQFIHLNSSILVAIHPNNQYTITSIVRRVLGAFAGVCIYFLRTLHY